VETVGFAMSQRQSAASHEALRAKATSLEMSTSDTKGECRRRTRWQLVDYGDRRGFVLSWALEAIDRIGEDGSRRRVKVHCCAKLSVFVKGLGLKNGIYYVVASSFQGF
jgi:hypothetical protein